MLIISVVCVDALRSQFGAKVIQYGISDGYERCDYYIIFKRPAVRGCERATNTLSVRKPQTHNTNPYNEGRARMCVLMVNMYTLWAG